MGLTWYRLKRLMVDSIFSTRDLTQRDDNRFETEAIPSGIVTDSSIQRTSIPQPSDVAKTQVLENNASNAIEKQTIVLLPHESSLNQPQTSKVPSCHHDSDTDDEELSLAFSYNQPLRQPEGPKPRPYYDDLSKDMVPRNITCNLTITFNEMSVFDAPFNFPEFVWFEVNSYGRLMNKLQGMKEIFVQRDLCKSSHEVYSRYILCCLRRPMNQHIRAVGDIIVIDIDKAGDHRVLANPAIRQISGFIHQYPFEQFELNFYSDYSFIERSLTDWGDAGSWSPNSGKFQKAIRTLYKEKMSLCRDTINKQVYLSHGDQRVFVTPENACRLIEDDAYSDPPLTETEKEVLIQEILVRPARILQAACVFDSIPMRFLYHFLCEEPHLKQRHSDNIESLDLGSTNLCDNELCIKHYERFVEHVYQFNPEIITSNPVHSNIAEHAVVPIRYVRKSCILGVGAFSTVYEVVIDPQYQLISSDATRSYALKIFRENSMAKKAFDREIKMLSFLSSYLPHEHILVHITSWEQNSKYYILYDKAHCNLRDHMDRFPGGHLTRKRVLWFLFQLRGLSDAVRRLHNCYDPDAGQAWKASSSAEGHKMADKVKQKTTTAKKTAVIGVHYDIKPENILIFGLPQDLPTLKLGDFGSAKLTAVSKYDSPQGISKIRGTHTYVGPESQHDMPGKMTRPFDMWALGCVFLELTLWFLGIVKPNGKEDFADMRLNSSCNSSWEAYDYFWQRKGPGVFEINDGVVFALDKLQYEICSGMQCFQDLVVLIRKLLLVMPQQRILARDLYDGMDAILCRATDDLQYNPALYSDLLQENQRLQKDTNDYALTGRLEDAVPKTGDLCRPSVT